MKQIDPVCGMSVDEDAAWKFEKDGEKSSFCSKRCLEKYASSRGAACVPGSSQSPCHGPSRPWYRHPAMLLAAVLAGAIAASYAVPALVPFRVSLFLYLGMIWWAILLGLFLGGVIDHYVPKEYISSILAQKRKRAVLYSVLIGFLMSVCSHGILALAAELHKKGASNAGVIAFLLASPWANLPLTLMLVGFFGVKAFFFIGGAITIAITTGLMYQVLERRGWIESNPHSVHVPEGFSIAGDFRRRAAAYRWTGQQFATDARGIWRGAVSVADMVLWWILLGLAAAALVGAYVPSHFFHDYMGPSVRGLFVTLGVATMIEVCSEGTSPLAFEIYRQTGAFGNTFVFLMAGVVTDFSEIGVIWSNLGRRCAIFLPVVTVPQVIALGLLANYIF